MIVECPRCRARYRVESGLLEEDQTFKCSRCSHIFAYEAESAASTQTVVPSPAPVKASVQSVADTSSQGSARAMPSESRAIDDRPVVIRRDDVPPEPPRTAPGPDESLSFSFRPRAEPEDDEVPEPRRFVEPSTRGTQPQEFAFGEDDEDGGFTDRNEEDDHVVNHQPRFVRGEDELRIQDEDPTDPTRSYLAFLAVLVVAYAIFALDLSNHPGRAEKLLAGVPIVGDTIAQDQLLQTKVHLEDVEGVYQPIKDDRSVFIVSGRAVNTSRDPLKGVQIESALYDHAGKPIEIKNIYCGNSMSLKIVKDLSSKEISLLQRLEPTKRFEIRPGESAGFSVVFLAPPSGVKEFTARVVSALASLS